MSIQAGDEEAREHLDQGRTLCECGYPVRALRFLLPAECKTRSTYLVESLPTFPNLLVDRWVAADDLTSRRHLSAKIVAQARII